MTWDDFQEEKELYKRAWEEMKNSFSGPIEDFLRKSYLVVSCGREFEIDADLMSAQKSCPAFFVDDPNSSDVPEIIENWQIEIKFPFIDIDFIQELKKSPYCDKDKTLMKASSTDVIILKEQL